MRYLQSIAATQACARPSQAAYEAEAVRDAGAPVAPDEMVNPMRLERIAFMNTFAQRFKDCESVAGMMSPTFFFAYAEQHESRGHPTALEGAIPPSDLHIDSLFPGTFAREDANYGLTRDTTMQPGFHVSRVVESWGGADIEWLEADFTLWDLGPRDSLQVHFKPSGATYEISQFEYRSEYN